MSKYKKINKEDVYKVMVGTHLDIYNPMGGAINLVNIANVLETSRYQVKKHMDQLKKEGLVELGHFDLNFDEEDGHYPPYWGYFLTEKGERTEYCIRKKQEELESLKNHFSMD